MAVVLGFQDDKKTSTSNNGQTIEFCQNPLLQRDFFYVKVSLRILSNFIFNLHCLLINNLHCLFTSYKICPVPPPTSQQKVFQWDFSWNYVRRKSYMCWTYQINSHSSMNKTTVNLKYWDNTILTEVFVKWDKIC